MKFKILIFLVLWILSQQVGFAQNFKHIFKADSMFIYKDFKNSGTTAGLWYNHRYLADAKALTSKLDIADLSELHNVLRQNKSKKLAQQKYGGPTCHILIYNNGQKYMFVAPYNSNHGVLDDITNMRRWTITDPLERERFYNLINKNWR